MRTSSHPSQSYYALSRIFATLFPALLLSAHSLLLTIDTIDVHSPLQTTNVYVRLLPPNCTDELLHTLGSLFGRPISVRALLERNHGAENAGRECGKCKGVGFILYENVEVARRAIVGLNELGWQASFAKICPLSSHSSLWS